MIRENGQISRSRNRIAARLKLTSGSLEAKGSRMLAGPRSFDSVMSSVNPNDLSEAAILLTG
jgi:hypothetical protein